MEMSDRPALILRYADVGIATYASLRVVGHPELTATWVVEETILLAALEEIAGALPDPRGSESPADALERALTRGAFTDPASELMLAYRLGVLLIGSEGWQLLDAYADQAPVLHIAPSARLGRIPWGLLARPMLRPDVTAMLQARQDAITPGGPQPAAIPWPAGALTALSSGVRLLELADVVMAVPANIARIRRVNQPRPQGDPLLLLDPRVPGQRPDSALGSVLGRPSADTVLSRHYAELMRNRTVLPRVESAVELFRRTDTDRHWLAAALAQRPGRLVFVGHASVGDSAQPADPEAGVGHAERAALHLACRSSVPGYADPIGDHRPLTAADLLVADLTFPTRVALLACASGGDYRFDEATGLVAAMVLGGAELVTATLWSLPTSAGYRRFTDGAHPDPMGAVIAAVDTAHQEIADFDAACAVNRWQRAQLQRWRAGDRLAAPVYWAALATFAVGQAGGMHTATEDSSSRR
ncbi:CHAT domain-containing protein [Mycolicibacterium neoaurum]|uniref:CHAT domain-containing protein n=1 Tax=Mycolicibacterium neoaurum TaxID=1795 RepID=UPI002673E621|nr:CHAT domain-containing protein [Mycolicibacterium neoaurum]MDO3398432.1 CHAT domain-containing protein [Mycolicibacterium neoaurum]